MSFGKKVLAVSTLKVCADSSH